MSDPGSMTMLAADLRSSDRRVRDEAATRIWERYVGPLLGLVTRNLDQRIQRREGPDDVLQSMYLSFVDGQRRANAALQSREDLWRLLVHITFCKLANTAKKHQAARRDVRRELPMAGGRDGASGSDDLIDRLDRAEPTAEDAMVLQEELEEWLRPLPPDLRQVALWRLEGYTNQEISAKIERTERSVELKLQIIRERLQARYAALLEE